MSKPTKGKLTIKVSEYPVEPWDIIAAEDTPDEQIIARVMAVCDFRLSRDEQRAQELANARLLAASKRMLKTLQWIHRIIKRDCNLCVRPSAPYAIHNDACKMITDAIAATGKEVSNT